MSRQRATLTVEIDLDPVHGWGNDAEDFRAWMQRTLDNSIGHYHPAVTITDLDATKNAIADELEDFAHNHVKNQTAGRIHEDLLERAAAVRRGQA